MRRVENVNFMKNHPGIKIYKGYCVQSKKNEVALDQKYVVPWELINRDKTKVEH